MFTGIIETVGTVKAIERGEHSARLTVAAADLLSQTAIGDSLSVNGVCLTVTDIADGNFSADVMHETLNRSALADLTTGSAVNLERALPANGRLDGHIVQGHVDGIGGITAIERDDTAIWYTIHTAPALLRYIVQKGAIAVDGISLTVARVDDTGFAVAIIPHTQTHTNLKAKTVGDAVNLETDIVAKYMEKLLRPAASNKTTTGQEAPTDYEFWEG